MKHPINQKEYNAVVGELDELLDIVGDNENHHLIGLVDDTGKIIASYEEIHYQATPNKSKVSYLKF